MVGRNEENFMKIFLEKAIFYNRAPFENLSLDFKENEIAVLSAVNGRGKTTILSHIVDAFYEMAIPHFKSEFEDKSNNYYRVSSGIFNLTEGSFSIVYFRFKTSEGNIDYVDIRNNCTVENYNKVISLDNKIQFGLLSQSLTEHKNVKYVLKSSKEIAERLFNNNLMAYFPSYRFEQPGYLTEPYKINLEFKKESGFSGHLKNPIEMVSGLPKLVNWIMDVVLDFLNQEAKSEILFANLNGLISEALVSKNYGKLKFGVGPRGSGSARIQIIEDKDIKESNTIVD